MTIPLEITKNELREAIRSMLAMFKASGVPEDGQVAMLAYWVEAHLNGGTKMKENE
jgi:hypothetical protein